MKATELAAKAKDVATNYKTAYIWGGIGLPITEATIQRAINQYSKNTKYATNARKLAGQSKAFYFDCVGLLKSLLWGWKGDSSKTYGGAKYASNGVPDISADQMIKVCSGVRTNFSNVQVGEALWTTGHIGIYIGDGLAVECTPSWDNGVQITAVANIGKKTGYHSRTWKKHGKLPYVTYDAASAEAAKPAEKPVEKPAATPAKKPSPLPYTVDPAKEGPYAPYAKTYTVTASALNMRKGASTTKQVLKVLPKGSKVTCYGYYTKNGATIWLYVVAADGTIGYCSKKYLA